MHSKRVPFFLSKVRNYSSHVIDNAAPSPSSFDNVASPTQAAPSPSLVDNVASPTSAAPSPSPVADVVSPLHMAPSWTPAPAPTTSCIKVGGSALNFITSVFKRKISLSTLCCQVISTISDGYFFKEFMHFKRLPFFLGKVRKYCGHNQILARE
ncbi:hypothetical protein H5410_047554 [Solanum commersonii]|uniref:Uncharacterized protein n=1 Tax=Solanum commersonii TaxID=4109 RepID=A0A9J5XJF8_SOLCO|nr:hypothetical protein H5410_047554 [Solanum commersonii]